MELLSILETQKVDMSIVGTREEIRELIKHIDISKYDEDSIDLTGDFLYLSSVIQGSPTALFVESVYRDNEFVSDDTEMLVITPSVPNELKTLLIDNNDYNILITP
jgi:hypothetical protein